MEGSAGLAIENELAEPVALAATGPILLGYEWSPPQAARPGDAGHLALLWQAGSEPPGAVDLYLQLSAGSQRWRRAEGHRLGGTYPAEQWAAGELVRDVWDPLLPAGAPAGQYSLALIARAGQDTIPLLELGQVSLGTRSHSFDAPRPEFAAAAGLGGVIRLLGCDLPASAAPGSSVGLTLHWQPQATPETSYVRFVHLLDAGGNIVAQQDGPPGGAGLPAPAWLPGEYLADRVVLSLPSELAPGAYRWVAGVYDPASGRRLVTQSGVDAIPLPRALDVR
jgi:hypothetical protein